MSVKNLQQGLLEAKILAAALPYFQQHQGTIIVIKFGGNAFVKNPLLLQDFAQDVVLLKTCGIHPVIVHGGGPQIDSALGKAGIKPIFTNGLRVTDAATMQIVYQSMQAINQELVTTIQQAAVKTIKIIGITHNFMESRYKDITLGLVGEPLAINSNMAKDFTRADIIPILAPIGFNQSGELLNINGDHFAGFLSEELKAKRLLFLTDIKGLINRQGELLTEISIKSAKVLLTDGTVTGGMLPKLHTAIHAAEQGVEAVVMVDGREPHAVLLELFTQHGIGTMITKELLKEKLQATTK